MKSLLFLCLAACSVFAGENPYLREASPDGKVEFKIEDKLRLPGFAWPRTLLSYLVKFNAPPHAGQGRLRDIVSGTEVASQLSDIHENYAVVNFFSDLPSGGLRRFEFAASGTTPVMPNEVRQTCEGNTILLDTGRLRVRLPATQAIRDKTPGPILSLNEFGDSTIVCPKHRVKSLTTEMIESGPLLVSCRVTYEFEGGGSYAATVKAIAGYDYVEFSEKITGLSREDSVFLEDAWTGFHPTHRMVVGSPFGGTRGVDEPMVQPFRGEDPRSRGRHGSKILPLKCCRA